MSLLRERPWRALGGLVKRVKALSGRLAPLDIPAGFGAFRSHAGRAAGREGFLWAGFLPTAVLAWREPDPVLLDLDDGEEALPLVPFRRCIARTGVGRGLGALSWRARGLGPLRARRARAAARSVERSPPPPPSASTAPTTTAARTASRPATTHRLPDRPGSALSSGAAGSRPTCPNDLLTQRVVAGRGALPGRSRGASEPPRAGASSPSHAAPRARAAPGSGPQGAVFRRQERRWASASFDDWSGARLNDKHSTPDKTAQTAGTLARNLVHPAHALKATGYHAET